MKLLLLIYLPIVSLLLIIYYQSSLNEWKMITGNSLKINNKNESLDILKAKNNISKIVGLVLYGRRSSVSILVRYLDINLKVNGGILVYVLFAVHTNIEEDLKFIENFTSFNSEFYKMKLFPIEKDKKHHLSYFKELYSSCQDNDIVFKIDDDIVFIKNGTFELMLTNYLAGKHYILSANVINNSQLSYVHARLRAILPFDEIQPYTWVRAENTTEIDDTVVFNSTYAAYSKWWGDGRCAAVAHESFLYHAYNNNLEIYNFGIWDFNSVGYHERVRINFIISWGKNFNKLNSDTDSFTDETYFSIDMPKKLKIHTISVGKTLVAHFSYHSQIAYLSKTNILKKYDNFSFYYINSSNSMNAFESISI